MPVDASTLPPPDRGQAGTAILLAVLCVSMMAMSIAALAPLAHTERLLAVAAREAAEGRYGAEAITLHAIAELQRLPAWDDVLAGTVTSTFADTTRVPVVGGSRRLNLTVMGAALSGPEPGSWGADRPRWVLYAWGSANVLAPGVVESSLYLAVWVADDERDGDADPARDTNDRLLVRGEAFGPVRGRHGILAAVGRSSPAPHALRLLDWRAS